MVVVVVVRRRVLRDAVRYRDCIFYRSTFVIEPRERWGLSVWVGSGVRAVGTYCWV